MSKQSIAEQDAHTIAQIRADIARTADLIKKGYVRGALSRHLEKEVSQATFLLEYIERMHSDARARILRQ